jgi:hypothetical protein
LIIALQIMIVWDQEKSQRVLSQYSHKFLGDAQKDSLDRDFQSIASKYKGTKRTGEDDWDNQRSPYQQLRGSERAIEGEIDRAYKAQDDRLEREIKNNSNYRQDLQKLRANIEHTNVPGKDYERDRIKQRLEERELELSRRIGSPYLNEYEEEVIKRRQHEKELEVAKKFSPRKREGGTPDRANIRAAQERREEEIIEGYIRKGGRDGGDRLKESIASNKTFELSQSLKSSVNYREKIGGGLKTLEAKIDNMERELDQHLQRNEKAYFTNKELVKATQKKQTEEDEEDDSPNRTKKNQFQEAFARRENKIKEASNYIERSDRKSSRRDYEEEDEEDSPHPLKRAYEDELDKLKYLVILF